jgi:hypothetical protein
MLARLEVAYLGMLRVVLLVAATLALVVTVVAAVTALPALGVITGVTGNEDPKGGTLGEFVRTNRISDVQPAAQPGDGAKSPLPGNVAEAAKSFARYDARNGGNQLKQSEWDDVFRSILTEHVPLQLQEAYGADVLRLSNQLAASKGKPLSDQRLGDLLQFHLEGFVQNASSIEEAKSAEIAGSMSKLVLAGMAFAVFVLVLFNFIFVKIERNLRPAVNEAPETQQ